MPDPKYIRAAWPFCLSGPPMGRHQAFPQAGLWSTRLEMYTDLNEFKAKFYRQLQINLNNDDFFKHAFSYHDESPSEVIGTHLPDIQNLSLEARLLLKEASQDLNGHIIRDLTLGGFNVETNEKQMLEDKSARNEAIWEAAIGEIEKAGLIVDRGHKREIFRVTRKGYELANY